MFNYYFVLIIINFSNWNNSNYWTNWITLLYTFYYYITLGRNIVNQNTFKAFTLLFALILINCDVASNNSKVTGNIYLRNDTSINITYETKPSG